jgi:hypothetical protein
VALVLLLLLPGFWAPGCGQSADHWPRQPVSGKVTVDGQPLDSGEIAFVPGGDGPAAGGLIQNGKYAIGRGDGPVPGPHRVLITSAKPTGKKIKDEADPKVLYDERAETIPARYNAQSQLTAEVKPGGSNTFDFALTTGNEAAKPKN